MRYFSSFSFIDTTQVLGHTFFLEYLHVLCLTTGEGHCWISFIKVKTFYDWTKHLHFFSFAFQRSISVKFSSVFILPVFLHNESNLLPITCRIKNVLTGKFNGGGKRGILSNSADIQTFQISIFRLSFSALRRRHDCKTDGAFTKLNQRENSNQQIHKKYIPDQHVSSQ